MTEEELRMIVAVGDAMRANPRPWSQLTDQERAVIVAVLRPQPTFTQEQRAFITKWWVSVTDADVEQINELMPANCQCVPKIDKNGSKWLSCDLFTDALENRRLSALVPILEGLTLEHKTSEVWPPVVNEP